MNPVIDTPEGKVCGSVSYLLLDLIIGGRIVEDLPLSNGINFIMPLIQLLQGTIKKKIDKNKVSVLLDIPFCEADEQAIVEKNVDISEIKKDPLLLTKHRTKPRFNKYCWGLDI